MGIIFLETTLDQMAVPSYVPPSICSYVLFLFFPAQLNRHTQETKVIYFSQCWQNFDRKILLAVYEKRMTTHGISKC